jgi:hypothetical protein
MERNILLGIGIITIFILGYKLYTIENYSNIVESEFITIDNNNSIYKNYLQFIVNLIPGRSNEKKKTTSKSTLSIITNKIYEYFPITYAPTLLLTKTPTPSTIPLSTPSPSSSKYPFDINLVTTLYILLGVLLLIFIVSNIPYLINLLLNRDKGKSPSNSLLNSSDMSTTEF